MKTMIPAAVTAALLVPATGFAAEHDDPPAPADLPLRSELAGHVSVGAHMKAAGTRVRTRRTHVRLARRVARLEGRRLAPGYRGRAGELPIATLRERNHDLRERLATLRLEARERRLAATATPPHLAAIAACESGGDPAAIGGGGLYRGKYQFDVATWQSVGGSGDPAAAPEAEQDRRAAMLYARAGAAPWPVCG